MIITPDDNFNFVFQCINFLFILKDSLQKKIQQGQITALRPPIDSNISADYSSFKTSAQKIEGYCGCVASGNVLLKTNIILFKFCKQKFISHGTMTLSGGNCDFLLIFELKWTNDAAGPKTTPITRCKCASCSMIMCGSSGSQMEQFYLLK